MGRKMKLVAAGNVLDLAVTFAEIIKRRLKGLHQVTSIGSTEIVDRYLPKEEGLDVVEQKRNISHMEIVLSLDALDTNDVGYQAPLPESEVKEVSPEELTAKSTRKGGKKGKKG